MAKLYLGSPILLQGTGLNYVIKYSDDFTLLHDWCNPLHLVALGMATAPFLLGQID
jgi:hypothetical protein